MVSPGASARSGEAPAARGAPGRPLRGAPGTLLTAAALGAAPFVGRVAMVATIPVLLLVAYGCSRRGETPGRNAAIAGALALGSVLLPVGCWAWPVPILLVLAAALRPAWRGPDGIVPWFRRGTLSRGDVGWIVAVAATSGAALVAWKVLRRPDVSDLSGGLPALPTALLLGGGTAWAALNALGEESIFRGALFAALERAFGIRAAVVLQAIPFGLVHWHGFPRGIDGAVLAAVYGLMMGVVRRRTGGLLAPTLAHLFADVVILVLLVAAR